MSLFGFAASSLTYGTHFGIVEATSESEVEGIVKANCECESVEVYSCVEDLMNEQYGAFAILSSTWD